MFKVLIYQILKYILVLFKDRYKMVITSDTKCIHHIIQHSRSTLKILHY